MQDKQWQPPVPGAGDMRAVHFAHILVRLPRSFYVSDLWDEHRPPRSKWWYSQRAHMAHWFGGAESPGAYGRKRPQTAKQTYNRLLSPGGLLWIAEAVGVDEGVVREAARAAWRMSNVRSQCSEIRRVIPWSLVYELVNE